VAVTAVDAFTASGNLVATANNERGVEDSGIPIMSVVTTDDVLDVVRAADPFVAAGNVLVASGDTRFAEDSGIALSSLVEDSDIANMVTAAATFANDNRILSSDGTGRGSKSSASVLDVVGGVTRFVPSSGTNHPILVGAGVAAGASIGIRSICIGQGAVVGSGVTIGTDCIITGWEAGADLQGTNTVSIGARNIIQGRGAASAGGGFNVTTGADCFITGQFSGARSVIGTNCVGFGNFCMFRANIGIANLGIGERALGQGTVAGNSNLAMGSDAGRALNNSSASRNLFIGVSSGHTITAQASNVSDSVAIGRSSFTEQNFQVAIGSSEMTICTIRGSTELRNGTTSTSFFAYNTFSSSSNYERLACAWATNECRIQTQSGGTGGTDRDLALGTASTNRLTLHADGTVTLDTVGNLPTSEPASGSPGTLWLDASDTHSAILKVTVS
jgi:hypothetical protein